MIYNSTGRMKQCANGNAIHPKQRLQESVQLSKIPSTFIFLCSSSRCCFFFIGVGQLVNLSTFHWRLGSRGLHRSQFPCLGPPLHPSLGTLGRSHGTGLLGLAGRLLRPGLMKGVRILGTGLVFRVEMSGEIRG